MKWLLGVVCVVAMSCGASKCPCSSTIAVSLSASEYAALSDGVAVKFCLDEQCYDFVASSKYAADSKDGSMSMNYSDNPPTMLFVAPQLYGDQSRDARLTIGSSVNRTWADVQFTYKTIVEKPECDETCVQAGLL